MNGTSHLESFKELVSVLARMEQSIGNIVNDIYKELGPGHRECVYHRAFELELRNRCIDYECEVVVPLFYKGQFLSHLRLDLVVAKKYIVELKATRALKDDDVAQLRRYMNTTCIPNGLLVNFGHPNSCELRHETLEIIDVIGLHSEEECRKEETCES